MLQAINALLNPHLQDINPLSAGWSINPPGHYMPPKKKTYYLIHFVRSGCGTVTIRGETYPVRAGQAFIIPPGELSSYTADQDDPWSYQWISFTGTLAPAFSALPTVFQVPDSVFHTLRQLHEKISLKGEFDDDLAYLVTNDLLLFYARILKKTDRKDDFIQQILDHVNLFYMQKISVEGFARQFGMDRHHMTQQFKEKTGCTVQDYIQKVRMTQSRRYLQLGYSVKETALLCGYSAPSIFSKLFKKYYGESPKDYRKRKEQKRNSKTEG